MKLSTLEPLFIGYLDVPGHPDRRGLGFSFLCPLCKRSRISILFRNPVDGGQPAAWITPARFYRRGSTIEDLTITQEINARGRCYEGCPGFRGYLRSGEARFRTEVLA